MRVPEAPALRIVPTVVGAVNDASEIVSVADPTFGVDAYCAVVDMICP
jgi:hypothetical protein